MKSYTKLALAACVALLVVAAPQAASASMISGSFSFNPYGTVPATTNKVIKFASSSYVGGDTGMFTYDGPKLNTVMDVYNTNGHDFAAAIANCSHVIMPAQVDLTGWVNNVAKAKDVPNFMTFGGANNDRFHFEATMFTYATAAGLPNISGSGTLRDSLGVFADSPALFTMGWSGTTNYSGSFAVTPEPVTMALLAVGGLVTLARRRK